MTSQHPHPSAPQCYTDYALQEYALERFSEGLRSDITNHLDTCAACKNALKSIEREICYFQQIEALGHEINDQNCLDDIQMASFLDAAKSTMNTPPGLPTCNSVQVAGTPSSRCVKKLHEHSPKLPETSKRNDTNPPKF